MLPLLKPFPFELTISVILMWLTEQNQEPRQNGDKDTEGWLYRWEKQSSKKSLDFKSKDGDKFPMVSTSERDDTSLMEDRLRLQFSVN